MHTFLFTGHPAAGHLNPLISIAARLRVDGHTVVFSSYGQRRIKARIEAEGFRFVPVRPAPSSVGLLVLPLFGGYAETSLALRGMFSGLTHYARQYRRVLDDLRPDVVVSEMAFHGSLLAAEQMGIPHALVGIAGLSLKGPGIPPFGSGLPIGTPASQWPWWLAPLAERQANGLDASLDRTRRRLGLPPGAGEYLARQPARWLNLTLTAQAIEASRDIPPPETFFVGPCLSGRSGSAEASFPFERLSRDKPKVYVSLGTVFNRKPRLLRRILQALHGCECQVIISAGGSYRKLRAQVLPEDVLLFESVPQVALLDRVDIVISHGGNNTVNETLAAGKPLLVMPVGGEQGDNAARVVHLGVGLRADIKRSGTAEIAEKINRLIREESFAERAQSIARELAETDGPRTAARFLTRLAQTRQPIRRRDDYPLTVRRDTPPPWEVPA